MQTLLTELQKQITEVEKEIEVLKKETDYWTLYREKDQFYHATYIEVLKQQIRNMNTSFSYLHGKLNFESTLFSFITCMYN